MPKYTPKQIQESIPWPNVQKNAIATVYVTVVFAQMERETIAARVTDNMLGLAKKGYWTGGNPPVGYVRKHIVVNGKKHCSIEVDPDGARYVTQI